MACLLRNYRAYLVPIQANSSSVTATDSTKLFDIDGFQRSKERAYHKYYSSILRTQMFSRFIEENSLGSPGRDESLAFFEECTQLVDDSRDQPPLLERDRAVASEHTKLVMPPEPTDPDRNILYDGIFPLLDEALLRQEESNESESKAPRCTLKQFQSTPSLGVETGTFEAKSADLPPGHAHVFPGRADCSTFKKITGKWESVLRPKLQYIWSKNLKPDLGYD